MSKSVESILSAAGFIPAPMGDAWFRAVSTADGTVTFFASWDERRDELTVKGVYPCHGEVLRVDFVHTGADVRDARFNVVEHSVSAMVYNLVAESGQLLRKPSRPSQSPTRHGKVF